MFAQALRQFARLFDAASPLLLVAISLTVAGATAAVGV
jgi:hypothetical protein